MDDVPDEVPVRFKDRESIEQAIADGEFDALVVARFYHIMRKGKDYGLDLGGPG